MTTEDGSVPQVLAVVLARVARVIAQGGVHVAQVIGDEAHLYNYATLLSMYADEALLILRLWVELDMPGFSLRPVDSTLLLGYDFPSDSEMLIVGFCYASRPQGDVVTALYQDERVYCLSAPQGLASGIEVRRLR